MTRNNIGVYMILITGGAGYIGSHTIVSLLEKNIDALGDIVLVDNYCNSRPERIQTLEQITGKKIRHYKVDCCDEDALEKVFQENAITACIHFAGLKAVGESKLLPLEYYKNNMVSTLNVLAMLKKYDAKRIIFSSSATVYGLPKSNPIDESFSLSVTNPYGQTKLMTEDMLRDIYAADASWSIGILRYFNPIGAHPSGLIGDYPVGIPNNIMPYISQVASGKQAILPVFGNDYDTHDGTGVRDYIHVMDLAEGHVAMLQKLFEGEGLHTYNLGTGVGYSVLDLVQNFEKVSGKKVPYEIRERRAGDIGTCFANPDKALVELGWKTQRGLEEMIRDTWNFEMQCKAQ